MHEFNKEENITEAIADAQDRTCLCLSDAHLVDADLDAIFEKVKDLTHLTEIDLSNNALTDAGIAKVKAFCSSHPNIQTLTLNYVIPMTDKSAIELLNVNTVKELLFWNNKNIKGSFAQAVLQQDHLLKLDIRDTTTSGDLILSAHAHARRCAAKNSHLDNGDGEDQNTRMVLV